MQKNNNSPYDTFTRDTFMYNELRVVTRLMAEGLSREDIKAKVIDNNLFQYPSEKMLRDKVRGAFRRIDALNDEEAIAAIAKESPEVAKQICLYAMMRDHKMVWDFMVSLIGEKLRVGDYSFSKQDVNNFMTQLQAQDEYVASWSDQTAQKHKSVLIKLLVDNGYLDRRTSKELHPVYLEPMLEAAITRNHDEAALCAFNCFK